MVMAGISLPGPREERRVESGHLFSKGVEDEHFSPIDYARI